MHRLKHALAAGLIVISRGETLYHLALVYLHDGRKWPLILAANPALRDPHRVPVGFRIRIPGLAPPVPRRFTVVRRTNRGKPIARPKRNMIRHSRARVPALPATPVVHHAVPRVHRPTRSLVPATMSVRPARQQPFHPDPWLAAGLSLAIPGSGQLYERHFRRGLVELGIAGMLLYGGAWLQDHDQPRASSPFWIGLGTLSLASAGDAYLVGTTGRGLDVWARDDLDRYVLPHHTDPWIDAGASLIFPGLGEVVLGDQARGWKVAAAGAGFLAYATYFQTQGPLWLAVPGWIAFTGLALWSPVDAYLDALRHRPQVSAATPSGTVPARPAGAP